MDPRTVRIFISSPGDVAEERRKAQQVIAELARRYAGRLALKPILWEDLPLMADMSFQQGIEMVLDAHGGIDIAVFILWSRLGSPLGKKVLKPDGTEYRSGTEREWDLMRAARIESLRHHSPNDARPKLLAYVRNDEAGFAQSLQGRTGDSLTEAVVQRDFARQFVREQFYDAESGTNLGAYTAFREPVSFAHRLRTHLRELLDGMLPDVAAPIWDGAPYQGLESFGIDQAAIFCGREREVCALDERFRLRAKAGCPFVLLVGASGSGKSSLARAGWLHYMLRENLDASVQRWLPIVMTPGQAKEGQLIGLLAEGLGGALPELRDDTGLTSLARALRESPRQAWDLSIRRALHDFDSQDRTRLVLLVDQLEELFTDPAITAEEADYFLRAVGLLVHTGQLWCLATVRSDFYDRCLLTPALMELKGAGSPAFRRNDLEFPAEAGTTSALPAEAGTTGADGQMDLLPPDAGALHRIITLPASFAGLRFEASPAGETLDARILAETAKHPEALPLLEYLLRELYEGRSADGRLMLATYDDLGGVEGALRSRAEKAFNNFAKGDTVRQAALGELLNSLVTMADGEEAAPVRRRASLQELPEGPCRELARLLVEERLLVSDRGQISVAHEALLRRWERAAAWIAENREGLRIRARVALAAGRWKAEGEEDSLLLPPGKPLAEAAALWTTRPRMLGPDLQEYVRRSQQRQLRAERRKRSALQLTAAVFAALALVAVVAAAFSFTEWRAAQSNAATAQAAEARANQNAKRADESAAAARGQARLSLQVLNSVIVDIQRGLANVPGALDVRRKILATAVEGLKQVVRESQEAQVDLATAAALADTGNLLMRWGGSEKEAVSTAREYYEQAHSMFKRLAEADPADAQAQRNLAVSCNKLGDATLQLGQAEAALRCYQDGLLVSKKAADANPRDAQTQRDLSISFLKLGGVMTQLGRTEAALRHYQNALAINKKLADADPRDAQAQRDLAVACFSLGDLTLRLGQVQKALLHYQDGLAINKKRADAASDDLQAQRDLSVSYGKLGELTLQIGQNEAALRYFQDCLPIDKRLAEADARDARAQRDLVVSYNKLGDVALQLGRDDAALRYYQDGLALSKTRADADSRDAQAQRDLSISYNKLGSATLLLGRPDAALRRFEDSLSIRKKLAEADPGDAQAQRDVAVACNNLGRATLQLGQAEAALHCFQDGLAISKKLSDADSRDAQAQRDLSVAYFNLGDVTLQLGQTEAALRHYQDSLAIATQMAAASPENAQTQSVVAMLTRQIAHCRDVAIALKGLAEIDKTEPSQRPMLLYIRCRELARRGEIAAAEEAAARLRSTAGADAGRLYLSGRGYALCLRALETPPVAGAFLEAARVRDLSAAEAELRNRYVRLALDALQAAVAAGFPDRKLVENDDDLARLRGLPEFHKLLDSLPTPGPQAKPPGGAAGGGAGQKGASAAGPG